MRVFFSLFLLIFCLEDTSWAQDPDTLLEWHIPQTSTSASPTSEYFDSGSALQSGASLLAQADQQEQQQQPPNTDSLTDQTSAEYDNSWDSDELLGCVSDKMINGRAVPALQRPEAQRRRARRWKKRDQQPAVCPQAGPTYIQPKIAPDLIKNPAFPVSPAESERFRIPLFPASNKRKGDNPTCIQKTLGWLPLGICDSGVASDRYESVFDVYGVAASLVGQVTTGLENCVLGVSFFFVLPALFFCSGCNQIPIPPPKKYFLKHLVAFLFEKKTPPRK